jgi:hypothetical protein
MYILSTVRALTLLSIHDLGASGEPAIAQTATLGDAALTKETTVG